MPKRFLCGRALCRARTLVPAMAVLLAATVVFPSAAWALTAKEAQKLLASDGAAGDEFGWSVSLSGDTALIGARFDDNEKGASAGAAYVFTRDGAGDWMPQDKLVAFDGMDGDQFGVSVSLSGDTALVGAPFDDNANGGLAGAAYVFIRDDETGIWTHQAKLVPENGAVQDFLGWSVSLSGDTALVGAHLDDNDNGTNAGAAYVFTRDGGNWTERDKLVASDGDADDFFGVSVSLSGDTALIGAHLDDDDGSASGSAYIFTPDATTGLWEEQAKLVALGAAADDFFGLSVSLSGDTALIGARGVDDKGTDSGAAYVFTPDGETGLWTEQAKLLAADGAGGDFFGVSVFVSGDAALIGARLDDDRGPDSGSAYVFARDGTGDWTQQDKVLASDGATGDIFGNSVALSGDTALIGARRDDDAGTNSGSAYVFNLCDPVSLLADLISQVMELNLRNGVSNSLDAKLDNVLNALDDANENDDVAAIDSIEGFINAVEAQSGDFLTIEQPDEFIESALDTIDCLAGA